jgi:cell division protein FtsL
MDRRGLFWILLLVVSVLVSGIAVVWSKNRSRALFVDLQRLRVQHELASMEWGRLQLELANVGSLDDVMRTASSRLHMHAPAPDQIVVIE